MTNRMSDGRQPVRPWTSWRDIFASEKIRVLGDPGKTVWGADHIHTWPVPATPRWRDDGPMYLSSFVVVDVNASGAVADADRCGLTENIYLDVTVTAQAIEAVTKHTIHIDNDTMNFRIILWPGRRALVVCNHGKIIGDVWVAKIDAATIPDLCRVPT